MAESILNTRHSARAFEDRPVDESVIREIIADAQLAPSWGNSQPAKAYVLIGDAAKRLIDIHHNNIISETKAWVEVTPPQPEDWNPINQKNLDEFIDHAQVRQGDALEFHELNTWNFHAPAIVYITIPKCGNAYMAYDAGAFGYGVCLSAHVHGLASIPAYEFIRFPEEIRNAIEIPEDEAILMGIGIGYPTDSKINDFHKISGRLPLDSVLKVESK